MTDKASAAGRVSLVSAVLTAMFFFAIGCEQNAGSQLKTASQPGIAASGPAATQAAQPSPSESPDNTASAGTPATEPTPASLPAKALLSLAEMTPAVEKPVNKPYTKKLPEQAVKSLAEAQKLLADKNIPGAISELERASGFDPQNPEVRRTLGLAYAALPDFGKAEDNLQIAVKTMPDDFESQMILGRIAALQRNTPKAIQVLRTALKCTDCKGENPKAASALWSLAQSLEKEGYWTAALECMEKLADWTDKYGQKYESETSLADLLLNPEKLLVARGRLLLSLRKYDQAAALLERAWKRDRSNLQNLQMLLESLAKSGRHEQAEQIIVQVATDKSAGDMAGSMAESFCVESRDKSMPERIWKAYRAKTMPRPTFGAALARAAMRLGAKEDAIGIAKSLIADSPNNPQAISLLAKIYMSSNRQDEAFRTLARAIDANPYNQTLAEALSDMLESDSSVGLDKRLAAMADADQSEYKHAMYYLAGVVASNRGNASLAIEQFTRAIDEKSDFYPSYQGKFDLLLVLKKKKEASDLLDKLEKANPKGSILPFMKAKMTLTNGNLDEALDLLDAARHADPQDVQAAILQSQVMLMQGRQQEAIEALESAIGVRANRGNADLCRQLFDFYMRQRRTSDAQAVAANLMEHSPLQAKLLLADYYIQTQDKPKAIAMLEQIQMQHGQNVQAKLLAVQLAMSDFKGLLPKIEYDRIAGLLEQIVRLHPGSLAAKKMLGTIAYQHCDYAMAGKVWRDICEQTMKLPENIRVLASILIKDGDYKRAEDVLEEALNAYPDDFEMKLQYIGALKKDKKYAQADKLIDQWANGMEQGPALNFLVLQKLVCLGLAKEYDKTVKIADELLDVDSESLIVRQELLSTLLEGGKAAKAMELVEDGLNGNWHKPDNQPLFDTFLKQWKIRLLCKTGKIDEAVEFGKEWCQQEPEEVRPRQSLIGALVDVDKADMAIKIVDEWLKALNADGSKRVEDVTDVIQYCWEMAVNLRLFADKPADALARVDKYLKYAMDTSKLYSLKSAALMDMGKKREGMAALEKAYSSDNTNPAVNNDLSYNYAEANMTNKLDKAEKMIRFAIQQLLQRRERVYPAEQDTLGWVLYKRGKFSESGSAFNEALDMLEEEPSSTHVVIYDHAGDVMYRLGWTARASALWKQACEVGQKEKHKQKDVKQVLELAPKKIKAAESGGKPEVAPTAVEAAMRPASRPATAPVSSRPATKRSPASQPGPQDDDGNALDGDDESQMQPEIQPAAFIGD